MNIINFTPLSALTGGLLIGFAVFLLFAFNGRMAGVSSIAANFILKRELRVDNSLFLIGLILGPTIYSISGANIESVITNSIPILIIAGLAVGIGTRIGNGCTSGHGICGIGRLSIRSIVGTCVFVGTGFLTVLITRSLGWVVL